MADNKVVDLTVADVVADLRLTHLKTDARSADVIEKNMLTALVRNKYIPKVTVEKKK